MWTFSILQIKHASSRPCLTRSPSLRPNIFKSFLGGPSWGLWLRPRGLWHHPQVFDANGGTFEHQMWWRPQRTKTSQDPQQTNIKSSYTLSLQPASTTSASVNFSYLGCRLNFLCRPTNCLSLGFDPSIYHTLSYRESRSLEWGFSALIKTFKNFKIFKNVKTFKKGFLQKQGYKKPFIYIGIL